MDNLTETELEAKARFLVTSSEVTNKLAFIRFAFDLYTMQFETEGGIERTQLVHSILARLDGIIDDLCKNTIVPDSGEWIK